MAKLESRRKNEKRRVGLLYDKRMCEHHTPDGEDHPENPNRIRAIWEKLQSAGIPQRHEFGSFFRANDDGSYKMVREGPGTGYNINVPWEHGQCGDADYLAVWDHILVPVAKEFNPDLIIVSSGFDAAIDDPLGDCHVTPRGYSVMLNKLLSFANGKIVLALEGGYNLESTANSMLACIEVPLEDRPVPES